MFCSPFKGRPAVFAFLPPISVDLISTENIKVWQFYDQFAIICFEIINLTAYTLYCNKVDEYSYDCRELLLMWK